MEPNFIDEGHCDVFINKSEIRLEIELKMGGFKKFQVFTQKMMIQCNLLWKNCMKVKMGTQT